MHEKVKKIMTFGKVNSGVFDWCFSCNHTCMQPTADHFRYSLILMVNWQCFLEHKL